MKPKCIYWLFDPRDRDVAYGPYFMAIEQTRKAKQLLNEGWGSVGWIDIYRDGREVRIGTMEVEYVDEWLAVYEEATTSPSAS